MRINVFVIDDEPNIIEAIKDTLPQQEFIVQGSKDPDEGVDAIARLQPDLVLLDWNLGPRSGVDVCRTLRKAQATSRIPVIMLTVVERTQNKVEALSAGADDYITKPFQPAELAARIKAVLRRAASGVVPSSSIKFGCLELNGTGYRAKVNGKAVELSTTEFEILYLLASRPGQPMTRETLLDHVCSRTAETIRTIDAHVMHLRKKLGKEAGGYIKTMHRVGYLFSPPD